MIDRRTIHLKRVAFAGPEAGRVFHDEAIGVEVYQYAGSRRTLHEMAFSGMRCRPDYHCHFETPEAALEHRTEWLTGKRSVAARKQKRVAARRAGGFRSPAAAHESA